MKKAKENGFFSMNLLYEIIDWKSYRSTGYWKRNTESYVKRISKKFFQLIDDRERMKYLRKLDGVGVPVASAILAVLDPKIYGVIDFHVWQALFHFKYVTEKEDGKNLSVGNWLQFLEIIRSFAQQFKVKARDIERTLFDWHRKKEQ